MDYIRTEADGQLIIRLRHPLTSLHSGLSRYIIQHKKCSGGIRRCIYRGSNGLDRDLAAGEAIRRRSRQISQTKINADDSYAYAAA